MNRKDKNSITISSSYDKDPEFFAGKFDSYGARVEDIDRAFVLNESKCNVFLELGCGNGRDAKYILSKTKDYIGLDASKGLLDIAKVHLPEADFKLQDIRNVEFSPETFGIIFTFATLLHVNREEMTKIIEKCHKWLKIGGILYISTKYGEYREEVVLKNNYEKYYYFYKPEDIEKLCPYKFFVVYKNVQDISGQSWFEIVLRKI